MRIMPLYIWYQSMKFVYLNCQQIASFQRNCGAASQVESETWKSGFIKRVDKGRITAVKSALTKG